MFIKSFSLQTILSPRKLFHATKKFSLWHKFLVVLLVVVIVSAFSWWVTAIYKHMTVPQPAYGGQYVEALVGQPRYINPLLARSSSDQNLTKLIFSSLFSYDNDGILQKDIAQNIDISDDVKEFTVGLRQDVFWHDGKQLTADDVVFTTTIAKDIEYGAAGVSSEMRLLWQNVQVEKIDDFTIKFVLEESNSLFAHSLSFGILPEHIWNIVGPEQFQLAEYNQKPIGTGPYEFVDLDINEDEDLIDSYTLRSYKKYHKGEPFITKFVANFYGTRLDAVDAYSRGEVSAVVVDQKEHVDALSEGAQKHSIALPRYFAVFFNQTKSVPLGYDEVREALSRATDREKIIAEVFGNDAVVRYSPFSEGVLGYDPEQQQATFDVESARILLDEKGWKEGEDGIRAKDDDRLSILLHVSGNYGPFTKIAEMLKEQWKEVGVELNIQEHDKNDLEKNILKPRDYDAVFYAHHMRFEPNLLPLWHSGEKSDPGVNYALFDNESMDEFLENLLKTKDDNEQKEFYRKQQEKLKEEIPAIFLFAPQISFMHVDAVKGISVKNVNASRDRYSDVHLWYIKEDRVRKE